MYDRQAALHGSIVKRNACLQAKGSDSNNISRVVLLEADGIEVGYSSCKSRQGT